VRAVGVVGRHGNLMVWSAVPIAGESRLDQSVPGCDEERLDSCLCEPANRQADVRGQAETSMLRRFVLHSKFMTYHRRLRRREVSHYELSRHHKQC
jgi:hypothetical protein